MLIQLVFHLKNLLQNGYCLRTDTLKEEYIIVYLAFCFSFSNNTYILDSAADLVLENEITSRGKKPK